jgi:predicted RNA-binding Zn-ribbon protein involved in translation (DUF1610 family)
MPKKLTQKEAEEKSLKVGIRMVGKYINSKTKIEFECPRCEKIFSTIPSRVWNTNTTKCKKCANVQSGNRQRITQKEAEEKSLSVGIRMIGEYSGTHINTRFQCPRCGKIFITSPSNIWQKTTKSCGCLNRILISLLGQDPNIRLKIAINRRIPKNGNSLADKIPDIAKEWHPTKNTKTPYEINYGSGDKVWWLGKCGHEWKATISSRTTNMKHGCPYCSNQKVLIGFNDLKTYCIKNNLQYILDEWDCKKNKLGPENYTKCSGKKIWWKCKLGHTWEVQISSRTQGRNCPICNTSKGETETAKILDKYNIQYKREYSYHDLLSDKGNLLRFDFYIPSYNLCIEFNGLQHYGEHKTGFFKESAKLTQYHDKLKQAYCSSHHIPLLTIHYNNFDNIEKILKKELKLS